MTRRHPYKGFIIEAYPYQLRDVSGWKTEFCIEKHDGSGITVTRFYFEESHVFETEEAAIEAVVKAGQRKIDAGFTPHTVEVLTN